MRHSKLILLLVFSLATILMIGCGQDEPKKRSRISTTRVGNNQSAANAAALATQFKGGAPVASNPAETLDVEKINQLVDQKINGAKKITLESVQLGSYQLTEIINVGRKMKPAQTQGKSQGEAVTIDGHSAKIEVDENGTIKLHALSPFGTKAAPVNSNGRPFNVAVQFDVLKEEIKVHSAIAYLSSITNGKRNTLAIPGNLEEDNLVVELKAARAKVNQDGVYVIRQDKDGAEMITVFENGDTLILSKDIQKNQGGMQQVISSLLIYKKIAAPATEPAATAQSRATAPATAPAPAPTAAPATAPAPVADAAASSAPPEAKEAAEPTVRALGN